MDRKDQQKIALSNFLVKKATTANLKASEAQEVLEEMAAALVQTGRIEQSHVRSLVRDLTAREKEGSTGIGDGCAIPHCACDGVEGMTIMIGRSEKGVDFGCVTGEKVHLFVLVLYPPHYDQERRIVLGRVLHLCRTTNWLKFLKAAKTAREMNDVVSEYDNEQ